LALMISCVSCSLFERSADFHLQKAIEKNPALFDSTTVVERDTVTLETMRMDTTFLMQRDTVVEYKQQDNLGREVEIRYLYNTITDSVEIAVDCPDQEVITEKETTIQTVIKRPKYYRLLNIGLILAVVIILYLVVKLSSIKSKIR